MNLIYGIKDKPRFGQVVLFAIQQLLAIMAATIAVPAVVNSVTGSQMSASAARAPAPGFTNASIVQLFGCSAGKPFHVRVCTNTRFVPDAAANAAESLFVTSPTLLVPTRTRSLAWSAE